MQNKWTIMRRSLQLIACCVLAGGMARADLMETIILDTSSLIGHPAGPFSIEFQLNDGSSIGGDANNTVTLSSFTFGGGSAAGAPSNVGGSTGSLAGSVTITDSSFFNEFQQQFSPGSTLAFHVDPPPTYSRETRTRWASAVSTSSLSPSWTTWATRFPQRTRVAATRFELSISIPITPPR